MISGLLFFVNKDTYYLLNKEDGILENVTAFTLLICSLLLFLRFIKVRSTKKTPWIVFNLLMIVGLFFGFGEEISWGQRIFNVESGEFFNQNNLQNETNLHNLQVNGYKINKIIFSYGFSLVFGLYFLTSWWLYNKKEWAKNLIDLFGVPIPQLIQSAIFLGLTIIIALIPDGKIWEVWECLFVITFLWILLEPFNKKEKLIQ